MKQLYDVDSFEIGSDFLDEVDLFDEYEDFSAYPDSFMATDPLGFEIEYGEDPETEALLELAYPPGNELEYEWLAETNQRRRRELSAIKRAIAQGMRNEKKLTDLIFYRRYPALRGQRLKSHQRRLIREWLNIRNRLVRPALHTAVGVRNWACPRLRAVRTTQRCINPQICRRIPDLLCATGVSGVPFEYVERLRRVPVRGLYQIVRPRINRIRIEKFRPSVLRALRNFVACMKRLGMPIKTILTMGSTVCRCMYIRGRRSNILSRHAYGEAIDIAGVRWDGSRRVTLVANYRISPTDRRLLRRIRTCLRQSFTRVIDYRDPSHRDHFHCEAR